MKDFYTRTLPLRFQRLWSVGDSSDMAFEISGFDTGDKVYQLSGFYVMKADKVSYGFSSPIREVVCLIDITAPVYVPFNMLPGTKSYIPATGATYSFDTSKIIVSASQDDRAPRVPDECYFKGGFKLNFSLNPDVGYVVDDLITLQCYLQFRVYSSHPNDGIQIEDVQAKKK